MEDFGGIFKAEPVRHDDGLVVGGGMGEKALVTPVHFPSTTYSRPMSIPSKSLLEEREPMISANSL